MDFRLAEQNLNTETGESCHGCLKVVARPGAEGGGGKGLCIQGRYLSQDESEVSYAERIRAVVDFKRNSIQEN